MTFPAVTICNNNRVNCDQLAAVIRNFSESEDSQTFKFLDNLNKLACEKPQKSGRNKRQAQPPPLSLGGSTPDGLAVEYGFLNEYMGLNDSIRHSIGHQFGAMIKACTFQGKDCLNERYEHYFLIKD